MDRFELAGVRFTPAKLTRANEKDELHLAATESASDALRPEQRLVARVALKDGRVLELPTTVEKARPKVTLVSKSIQVSSAQTSITLGSPDELPMDGQISFLLKTEMPSRFPREEKIEVATADEVFSAFLSVSDGSLVLRDAESVFATFHPLKAFGQSAFGALRFRPVQEDGTKGDWQPLATLVRIPALSELRCPEAVDKQCRLSGSNLFLIDSIASDDQFAHNAPVPAGFIESTLSVPHPSGDSLYIKLRDDPGTINVARIPVTPLDE